MNAFHALYFDFVCRLSRLLGRDAGLSVGGALDVAAALRDAARRRLRTMDGGAYSSQQSGYQGDVAHAVPWLVAVGAV